MADSSKPRRSQECAVQIDLPGQEIKCWNPKAKTIRVMLRKHRDVVFDVQMFNGMTYTIRSDKSDFYHADSKKLVRKRERISFRDGEKVHLWISREFEGSLILEAAGQVLGRYRPGEIDTEQCSVVPDAKPAPLVIVMRGDTEDAGQRKKELIDKAFPVADVRGDPVKILEKVDVQANADIRIVEIDTDGHDVPRDIANFIQSGGEQLQIDPGNVLTRNWCISQLVGGAAFYSDNATWIKELYKVKMYVQTVSHETGKRRYLIFRGDPVRRIIFGGTKYRIDNPAVLAFTSGIGSAKGLRHATWGAVKGAFTRGGLYMIGFNISMSIAEWLKDYSEVDPKTGKPKRDVLDLFIKIGFDLVKTAISAAITVALVGLCVIGGLISGGLAIAIGTVALGVAVGYLVDLIDGKLGIGAKLNGLVRAIARDLEQKMPKDYGKFESAIESSTPFEFGAS